MPYCVECGKEISHEIRMKNNGECDGCIEKDKRFEDHVKLSTAQISMEKLTKCAYCQIMTSVRCQHCRKPLCQAHLKMYKEKYSSPIVLCEECYTKETKTACIVSMFLIGWFLIPLLLLLRSFRT